MNNVHGIVYAYHSFSDLGELGQHRTGASLPFCGRYRLIDFALSSMTHAGIHDVGVIMQRGYQSLMDHIGTGRSWNMSRQLAGLRQLTPYGLSDSRIGTYEGTMEALSNVRSYLESIKQEYVLITRGDLCASIDMEALIEQHITSGCDITAACSDYVPATVHHRFIVGDDGHAEQLLCRQTDGSRGVTALETYITSKKRLLQLVDWCAENRRVHFHRDAMMHLLDEGWSVGIYMHVGYARHIVSIADYYDGNMDMLESENRASLFLPDRDVLTRSRSDVSTYYGDKAHVTNSIVADGCIIEGSVENCVLFRGVKVGADCHLKNCIILDDTVIGPQTELSYVISDKGSEIDSLVTLHGNRKLPIVIPKASRI